MLPRLATPRLRSAAALAALPLLALAVGRVGPVAAADPAPAPRPVSADKDVTPADLDKLLMDEVKSRTEIMKNLEFLSDTIGPRLTGSRALERANEWTAAKMREYGLENVRLEPWEMPVGWERGTASMRIVEPDTGVNCLVAAVGWTPGLAAPGKVVGEVKAVTIRTRADMEKYRGKLKNTVLLSGPPANVAPVSDPSYGPLPPAKKKDEPKKAEPKKIDTESVSADAAGQPPADPKKDAAQPPKKEEPKGQPKKEAPGGFVTTAELSQYLKDEGVLCQLEDGRKPHGLLVAYGQWKGTDRASPQEVLPRLCVAHEHYAMLWRLANRPTPAVTKVEVEISNKFVPGPIVCYNTVGEIKGSEKPDEFVIVGAHLDSWDLATGTMDNGTGSCVVLEVARTLAKLAREGHRPKRTVRFVLYTGEEQGLHGSRQYVQKHDDEMERTSLSLVHDTGTGRVTGFGVHGNEPVRVALEPELASLASMPGWNGLDMGGVFGSDHQAFHPKGVPGLACRQDIDEYRLTHHTQTDTFDHAKGPNLVQGAQVLAVTATRVANMSELLPRFRKTGGFGGGRKKAAEPKKDGAEPKKDGPPAEAPMPKAKRD